MDIIFFGSSDFAVPTLEALLRSRHRLLGVVTQPDRKGGRHLALQAPPVKTAALSSGIPVYQPLNASSDEAIEYLKNLKPDLFVVVAFGQILKKRLLGVPKIFSINLHGSLLPRYRGASPIHWALINGETTTGATVIRINLAMDAGDSIARQEVAIDSEDTSATLTGKISRIGAKLVLESLEMIERGAAHFEPQDESSVSYAPKLKKADGLIDWNKPASSIHNLVRGVQPWPGAFTYLNGKMIKIIRTETVPVSGEERSAPGSVVEIRPLKGIVVRTGSHGILITHLQLEGKKILDADSFLRGHPVRIGDRFMIE